MENLTTEKYPAVCSECGKECEVPFKPVTGRAVYCLDCFKEKHKNDVQVNVPGELFMELCSTFQIESPRSTLKISHPAVFKSYVCRILTEYCKKVKNEPVVHLPTNSVFPCTKVESGDGEEIPVTVEDVSVEKIPKFTPEEIQKIRDALK